MKTKHNRLFGSLANPVALSTGFVKEGAFQKTPQRYKAFQLIKKLAFTNVHTAKLFRSNPNNHSSSFVSKSYKMGKLYSLGAFPTRGMACSGFFTEKKGGYEFIGCLLCKEKYFVCANSQFSKSY